MVEDKTDRPAFIDGDNRKRRLAAERRLERLLYDALIEAGGNDFFGPFRPSTKVTIDGRFNLRKAAIYVLDAYPEIFEPQGETRP